MNHRLGAEIDDNLIKSVIAKGIPIHKSAFESSAMKFYEEMQPVIEEYINRLTKDT
jgi:hypothetical protein